MIDIEQILIDLMDCAKQTLKFPNFKTGKLSKLVEARAAIAHASMITSGAAFETLCSGMSQRCFAA